jgi:hypothetical protein
VMSGGIRSEISASVLDPDRVNRRREPMVFERKVAIITGASKGIGACLLSGFREKGYGVVANSRFAVSHKTRYRCSDRTHNPSGPFNGACRLISLWLPKTSFTSGERAAQNPCSRNTNRGFQKIPGFGPDFATSLKAHLDRCYRE